MATFGRIADVTLDHFMQGPAKDAMPANGRITVNHNTFQVSFNSKDRSVRAEFVSSNALANVFRQRTKNRLVAALRSQYVNWLDANGIGDDATLDHYKENDFRDLRLNKHNAGGRNNKIIDENNIIDDVKSEKGDENKIIDDNKINDENKIIEDPRNSVVDKADDRCNPKADDVTKTIDVCIDKLLADEDVGLAKICTNKAVIRAYMTPKLLHPELSEEENAMLANLKQDGAVPRKIEKHLGKLGEIAMLAAIRNSDEVINAESGSKLNSFLLDRYGIRTHLSDCKDLMDENDRKNYILRAIDNVLDIFQTIFQNKDANVVEFLEDFTGACIEAKTDNVQEYAQRLLGLVEEASSNETTDLAVSITMEFSKVEEGFESVFRRHVKGNCDWKISNKCVAEGITDEAEIGKRIEAEVDRLVKKAMAEKDDVKDGKESEYKAELRKYLKSTGHWAVYDKLFNAKRPITNVWKDENDGKWVVETLVDKDGKAVTRPLSAFEIDRQYDQMVDMYMDEAITMGNYKTVTRTVEEPPTFASRDDLLAEGVLEHAKTAKDGDALDALLKEVKAEFVFKDRIPDEELKALVVKGIDDLVETVEKGAKLHDSFGDYLTKHGVSGAYFDKMSDRARLAHILARSIEREKIPASELYLHDIDAKSFRFAKVMQRCYKGLGLVVNLDAVATGVKAAVKSLAKVVTGADAASSKQYAMYLALISNKGLFMTDQIYYNLSKRVDGPQEVKLGHNLDQISKLIMKFGGRRNLYSRANG